MILRDYQNHSLSILRKSFAQRNKRVILNAPTGFGKTVVGGSICKGGLEKGRRIVVLVHRIEILEQFYQTFRKFGICPTLIQPGQKVLYHDQFYLGMVETFRRRITSYDILNQIQPDLLICDEVHWGSYESIIERFGGQVIGFTATPKASSGQELNQYFDDCACPIKVSELIRDKYLLPGRTFSIEHDFSGVKLSGQDFNIKQLHEEFKKPKLFTGVLEEYEKHAKGRKAIVYSVNIEHSRATASLFYERGYRIYCIDANTPEREDLMHSFRSSEDGILFNVGIATTGFDEPSVGCIIENYATAQITKHVQVVGRGARPDGVMDDFIIIDMGRNYMRHGLYGEDVDWIAIFNNPKLGKSKREESQISNMECRECGAIIKTKYTHCPYCDTKVRESDREAVTLEKGTTKEIREYKIKTLPVHLRDKRPSQMNMSELYEFASHMGYNKKWVGMQVGLRKKYRNK